MTFEPTTPESLSFFSGGQRCAALAYRAPEPTAPWIVMAHGFGSVVAMRLDAYAERFQAAGFNVLAFDYRHFGGSEGHPRQVLDIPKQLDDWRAALGYVRTTLGADRVAIWGTSFSGGHVTVIAAEDDQISAVISQVPHMDGIATSRVQGVRQMARLTTAGIQDAARGLRNQSPHYVPAFGPRGSLAAMTREGEFEAAERLYPTDSDISRVVAARVFLEMGTYSPGRKAAKVIAPWLIQVASRDVTTPPGPARSAARRAPNSTLIEYDAGHFDPYVAPLFDRAVDDQIAFLRTHLR